MSEQSAINAIRLEMLKCPVYPCIDGGVLKHRLYLNNRPYYFIIHQWAEKENNWHLGIRVLWDVPNIKVCHWFVNVFDWEMAQFAGDYKELIWDMIRSGMEIMRDYIILHGDNWIAYR